MPSHPNLKKPRNCPHPTGGDHFFSSTGLISTQNLDLASYIHAVVRSPSFPSSSHPPNLPSSSRPQPGPLFGPIKVAGIRVVHHLSQVGCASLVLIQFLLRGAVGASRGLHILIPIAIATGNLVILCCGYEPPPPSCSRISTDRMIESVH